MKPRTFIITRAELGRSVAGVLRGRLNLSWSAARRLVREQCVRLNGTVCVDPARRVSPQQRVQVHLGEDSRPVRPRKASGGCQPPGAAHRGVNTPRSPQPRKASGGCQPPGAAPQPVIRYTDAQLVIVEKPAGLTTVRHASEAAEFGARARRFLPPTLAELLPDLLAAGKPGRRPRLRAVHRLDKDTSGLVVFACTPEAERQLGQQLRAHGFERRYLALVRGRAQPGRIESSLVRDRGDGRRGSAARPGEGQHAVTHVRLLENLGDYSLVECRLETGRTHQVRIHLGERGTPLCGERIYDRPLHGQPLPDGSGASRPMLHAATLGFQHPVSGKETSWTSPLPEDMASLLARLRRQG